MQLSLMSQCLLGGTSCCLLVTGAPVSLGAMGVLLSSRVGIGLTRDRGVGDCGAAMKGIGNKAGTSRHGQRTGIPSFGLSSKPLQ